MLPLRNELHIYTIFVYIRQLDTKTVACTFPCRSYYQGVNISDFLGIRWLAPAGPLIEPPRFSPIVADPSFLFPEETPDGTWQLFAHSAWGIHRYASPDGLTWQDRGLVARNAMRPFIRRLSASAGGPRNYYLYFEAYYPFALPLTALPFPRRWHSRLALTVSPDLRSWPRPQTVLHPDLPWMADAGLGASVSNPCLVANGVRETDGTHLWRLYYSASLAWIPDCGFCEPKYIGAAVGPDPEGPFAAIPTPLVDPAADSMPGVLGAGSLKALPLEDGWIGLQNKIYRSPDGRSRSAIFILRSEDGLAWQPARPEPLIAPSTGWMASHVYACDCRFHEEDGFWYLYFNARDAWRIKDGVERIGRLVGASG